MEIMKNPDLVAAILTAAIIGRLDYGKDSCDSERLARSAKEAFNDVYHFICGMNAEITKKISNKKLNI